MEKRFFKTEKKEEKVKSGISEGWKAETESIFE